MANNTSVTDQEAVSNVTVVTDKPVETVQQSAPVKQDLTALQVDLTPDADVSVDEFNAVKNGLPAPEKKVEVKADDKKSAEVLAKPEDNKADDKIVDFKQPDVKVTDDKVKTDDKEDKRVYDDLPEILRPIFKKLHNEPFNALKPIVKELESAKAKAQEFESKYTELKKGALPDNYYEHQKGYILAPEFEQAANTAIKAEQVLNHWKAQYERVRKGEATYQDLSVDSRTGELVLSDPMQVSKDTEAKLEGWIQGCQNQLMEKQYAVRSISEKHSSTHKQAVDEVVGFEKAAFKVFDGEHAKVLEPLVQDTIAKTFPAAFRNNPLARGYAKALLSIDNLAKQLKALRDSGGKAAETIKQEDGKVVSLEDKKKAGPSAADLANAGGGGGKKVDEEVTIDDFKKVKESDVYMRR